MTKASTGAAIARIGEAVLSGVENEGGKFFLYAEVGPEVVDLSAYEERDAELVWIVDDLVPDFDDEEDGDGLTDLILSAWYTEPEGRRWIAMEYTVNDGRFAVQFHYPGEIDLDDSERRNKLLAQRFPGKSVYYPPLQDGVGWETLERL